MNIEPLCILIIVLGLIAPVSAHGVDVTPESTIIIADESTGVMAKKVVDDLGVEVGVYKFKSDSDVLHQLEHVITNPDKKIIAIAYTDTVKKFLAENPDVSGRVIVAGADEDSIKESLKQLNVTSSAGENSGNESSSSDFLTPFFAGIFIGALVGLGIGAFWMKKKLS
ncbi:MAG: hypothetical protein QME14_08775 [Methanobacteriaceae archaeon]|nr:hypothetical protein [Methanobacteriaceae archaeon]